MIPLDAGLNSGYIHNLIVMCIMRGLCCGISDCLMVPNIVTLIGISFPLGKKRNLGTALFEAMAPVGAVGGSLIRAVIIQLSYWVMAFPAMVVSVFTIDLVTASAQIVASNAVPEKHQGVEGSLIGTLLSYGTSTGLGFAGTVEVNASRDGTDLLRGYHSAAYLAVGLSGTALAICYFIRFLRILARVGARKMPG